MLKRDFLIWHEADDLEFVGAMYESYAADSECVDVANKIGFDLRSRIVHPSIRVWSDYASSASRACEDIEVAQRNRWWCQGWHSQPCDDPDCA